MLMAVSWRLTLYLSARNRLSCPMETSKRLRAAIRGGFLSSSSVFGLGTFSRVDPYCDRGQGLGRATVGVECWEPQNNPDSNSWSAVRGTPNESVSATAGAPVESVVVWA